MLDPNTWMTCSLHLISGFVLIMPLTFGSSTVDIPYYRLALGCLLCEKWLSLLASLRQYKLVGLRILPILEAMLEVGPITFVLAIFVLATASCFYTFGFNDFASSFVMSYRMGVLGDFSLAELMYGHSPKVAAPKEYIWGTRVLTMIVTFFIGIVNMNVFVAVLCNIYSQAESRAELAFLRYRARILFDLQAFHRGRSVLKHWLRTCRGSTLRRNVSGGTDDESYIWICYSRV